MKTANKGRITRVDQAWAVAHREKAEREASAPATPAPSGGSVVPFQAAPKPAHGVEVIPATEPLRLPLRFVTAALLTSGKGDIRHYLNGVYLHAVDGEVRIAGTDGHRLIVSRFKPDARLPGWLDAGVIIPRDDLAQALPVLQKNGHEVDAYARLSGGKHDHEVVIEYGHNVEQLTVRSVNGFAAFKLKPIDGTFPDYARVLESSAAALARGESVMQTASIDLRYMKAAADVGQRLGATAINSFVSTGEAACMFTFTGAPDTVLVIMPVRHEGEQISDSVVKIIGPGGLAGSLAALRAHLTRTTKLIGTATNDKARSDLELRKAGFEARIEKLIQLTAPAPKQLAKPEQQREAA